MQISQYPLAAIVPAKKDVALGIQPKELGMYLLICKLAEISYHLNFSRH